MSTVIIFLVVIIVLVVAHEFGHFFAAKKLGVRVEEFGIGYPPRAKKLFSWKGTLFTLNWLPFGGFVRIFGEDTGTEDKTGSFAYQKLWKRVIIISAGIIANILLAIILYILAFSIGFLGSPKDFPQSTVIAEQRVYVTGVVKDSRAELAGIKTGDAILSLNSENINDVPQTVDDVVSFIKLHPNAPIDVSVLRGDNEEILTAAPSENPEAVGLGVSITEASKIRLPFFRAVGLGFTYTFKQFGAVFQGLGMIIGGAFTGDSELLSQVSGPVGIAEVAGNAYTLGFGSFLAFVALISLNLAVINLLPFPALDGGRLVLEFFASNGKSRISPRVVSWINQIGFLLLIVLMLVVTYKDIVKLIA